MSRQTQAIIHASSIIDNFKAVQALAPKSQHMAVIKADAYGHGAVNVARILRGVAPQFAVAMTEEAVTLREAGVKEPIVILEGPHQQVECSLAGNTNCILVAHSEYQLEWIAQCPETSRPQVWLKVDSGMHRLGFPLETLAHICSKYKNLLNQDTVLVTHMASADDIHCDFTQRQIDAFYLVAKSLDFGVSIANSPATLAWPQSHGHWNRIGVAAFGCGEEIATSPLGLKPAMTLQASVLALHEIKQGESVGYGQSWVASKDSLIATIGIGYADGYPRHCPSGTPVWVEGQRAPLAGRVSMDMITVDVTDIPSVVEGSKVELWGENIPIDEVAASAGTISYELMTRISARVPRVVRYR